MYFLSYDSSSLRIRKGFENRGEKENGRDLWGGNHSTECSKLPLGFILEPSSPNQFLLYIIQKPLEGRQSQKSMKEMAL